MLQVLQASPAGQQIHRNVEDVIGFVVGKMDLEDSRRLVDESPQPEVVDHLHDDRDPATANSLLLLGEIQFGLTGTNHRRLPGAMNDRNSSQQPSFAFSQLFSYLSLHSKPSVA